MQPASRISSPPTSPASIGSDDTALALKPRSDMYESRCRNLTKKVNRAVDRKEQVEQMMQDLQEELKDVQTSSSAYAYAESL